MRDRFFREDENELPYLVYSKRDSPARRDASSHVCKISISDRPFGEFAQTVRGLPLHPNDKQNIIDSIRVKPDGCMFSITTGHDGAFRFSFRVENEFFTSTFTIAYINHEFMDSSHYDDYGKMESSSWYRSEVSKIVSQTGLKFYDIGGGYHYKFEDDRLIIEEEYDVIVYFTSGDSYGDYPGYKIDFKDRKLVKYHDFSWFELSGPFYV